MGGCGRLLLTAVFWLVLTRGWSDRYGVRAALPRALPPAANPDRGSTEELSARLDALACESGRTSTLHAPRTAPLYAIHMRARLLAALPAAALPRGSLWLTAPDWSAAGALIHDLQRTFALVPSHTDLETLGMRQLTVLVETRDLALQVGKVCGVEAHEGHDDSRRAAQKRACGIQVAS